jgi:glycosyltransferase involved in cell wall biosynthesis
MIQNINKTNFIIVSINAYANYETRDMAGSMRIKNLFNPLLDEENISISNLILLDLLSMKHNCHNQSTVKSIDCLSIGYASILNPFSVMGFLKKGRRFIKTHKKKDTINIIYNYQYPDVRNILLLIYAKYKGYKIVFDLVEDKNYDRATTWNDKLNKKLSLILLKITPLYANIIFVISNNIFEKITKITGNKLPVFILPISVDFKNIIAGRPIRQTGPIKIFYGGSFTQKDGLEYLLGALDILSKNNYNFKLILSGKAEPADKERIFPLIVNNPNIEYVGFLSNVEYFKLLHSVDICCMTRNNSAFANAGFPFKLGEFLAAGKIVIASRIGEVEKYLVHKESAYLVKPESTKEIADGLMYCIDNIETLPQSMGAKAKSIAQQYFDAGTSCRLMLEKCVKIQ